MLIFPSFLLFDHYHLFMLLTFPSLILLTLFRTNLNHLKHLTLIDHCRFLSIILKWLRLCLSY